MRQLLLVVAGLLGLLAPDGSWLLLLLVELLPAVLLPQAVAVMSTPLLLVLLLRPRTVAAQHQH